MKKEPGKLVIFLAFYVLASAEGICQPAGYYSSAEGLTGSQLQQSLHNIICNHTSIDYTALWTAFQTTDKRVDGKVWDMYSDIPGGTAPYSFTFIINQCGNYNSEGDCYNREHSFPKSWFGGEVPPMYTDLFQLYPTDGFVNNQRGNYPLGVTSSPSWTSMNGSKLGYSSYPGYSGIVFEPVNGYKGDFARTYFYMAVRYYGEDSGWPGSDMVSGSQLKPWALKMLMEWDQADPVSQKEKDRNESVSLIQGNRNPFIDNPLYASLIWGTSSGTEYFDYSNRITVWPNPAHQTLNVGIPETYSGAYDLSLIDISGRVIINESAAGIKKVIDVSQVEDGYYLLRFEYKGKVRFTPVVISHL